MNHHLSRRTVLRGMGAAVALPFLEAMLPVRALAKAASPAQSPMRMAFLFVPNGIHMPAWTPTQLGPGYDLPFTLQPLKNVQNYVSVLTGLTQHNADALGDGPGDHARSASTWLTGVHPRKTGGADIHAGISADQVAAMHIGTATAYPSIEIGCESGAQNGECDSGYSCAYSSNISWRSANEPNAKEVDPREVFNRLFSDGADPHASAQTRRMRDQDRASILDFVSDDTAQLNRQLGSADRDKLDEYMTGVREIELRVNKVARINQAAAVSGVTPPTGIPENYGEHLRLMSDMMVLAWQTDLTRICTFMWANEGSNRSFREIGIPEGHHDLSHHGGLVEKQEKLKQINHYQVQQLAYLLEKLHATPDVDGASMLDNSMIVFGGGISDGNRHNHDDLPVLLAGGGGGRLQTGRHIVYPDGTPMGNLYLSLLNRIGVPAEALGDSTGRLQQIF